MEYLALYRKYRPNCLSDVVGQHEIKQILATSIVNNTISHAYLFSGPRGTGKTTMAKIFAKMVNCTANINGDACNKCDSCLNLLNSGDIIEIDAASNNGVDEIRNLREKANLVPISAKYKVYIIDEVHMLTTQAFNALLKTLEEPPKHVIFILATTEYYKIPLTIVSRCQKFQFNKLSIDNLVDRISQIAELEKINISKDAIYEISKVAEGSLRDAINYLDQLRSYSNGKIKISDVYNVCGNIATDDIINLFKYIRNNDVEKITSFFEKMDVDGKNFGKFLLDLIEFLKDVVLYKKNVNSKLIKYNVDVVKNVSEMYSISEIYVIINYINLLIDKLNYVSRQLIVVITNFLLIANNIDSNSEVINVSLKNDDEAKYEVAFDFTSNNDDVNTELTNVNLQKENIKENEYFKNRDIIINNTFAVANKDIKNTLQLKFKDIDKYMTDNKFKFVVSNFIDTNIEVAGEKYIIFSAKYDAIVDKIYQNFKICKEFMTEIFGDNYYFSVVTFDEWNKLRDEYIANIRNGKKYEMLDINETIVDKKENIDKTATIVDKLFELVGEDSVEIK